MKKLVLTGAAGALGSQLRAPLAAMCQEFVSSDLANDLPDLGANETYVKADVSDLAAMEALLKDADMVIHFGAIADEAPWDDILQSNIIGAYNVWEAAYRNGVKRVVYASSVHAVGMHSRPTRSALMRRTSPTPITGWPSASPKTSLRSTGTNAALRRSACASSRRPHRPTPAPSAHGSRQAI